MSLEEIVTAVAMSLMFFSLVGMFIVMAYAMCSNAADLDRREAEMDKRLGRKPKK